MAEDTTGILAKFAATLTYDQLPERVRECTKGLLLDALTCAIAGHRGEETPQIAGLASAIARSRESSVLGGERSSLAGATLLNGYLITAVTMCDVYRPALTHITPEVVPPALAIAERDDASGRELLVALAVGMEVETRLGASLNYPAFRRRGWHGPGVIGPFGAAAAVGHLIGLKPDRMAAAFGLAGSQAAGTFAAWGTPTVKFHQCRGALSGLMAALLAQQGFVATQQFLTVPDGGLYAAYTEGAHPEAATEALGDRWELEQIALRLWPAGSSIQGMITAMFDLVEKHNLRAENVAQLRIFLDRSIAEMHGMFPHYRAKFEALLSAHYIAAAILHDQELTLDQFEPQRYDDPRPRRFAAERVKVLPDPRLSGVQSRVVVETPDGRVLSSLCLVPKGSPENPLSPAEIEGKFRRYAKGVLAPAKIDAAVEAVNHLEDLSSTRTLMDALRSE